jgi:hypothetical protein
MSRSLARIPSALSPGQLTLALEGDLIVVSGHGLWTAPQMTAHLRRYADMVHRIRRVSGTLRVLVDLQDMGIQTPDVTEILARETARIRRDGDRIAMIVPGSLAKMQMRRVVGVSHHEYFASQEAARAWLSSED